MSIDLTTASLDTIEFLRSLTDDGHLSGEEVWTLANWLNDHGPATKVWPGDILVEPLQKAYADSSLSLQEMTELAVILGEIERNWASRVAQAAPKKRLIKRKASSLESLTLSLDSQGAPELPSLPIRLMVRSHSSDERYEVDLTHHTCECGDWVSKRSKIPSRNLGRCCKHLAEALKSKLAMFQVPEWFAAILADCCGRRRGIHPADKWVVFDTKNGRVAVSKGESDWINVFARGDYGFERFGYHLIERRWSYGMGPKGQRAIASAMHEWF